MTARNQIAEMTTRRWLAGCCDCGALQHRYQVLAHGGVAQSAEVKARRHALEHRVDVAGELVRIVVGVEEQHRVGDVRS